MDVLAAIGPQGVTGDVHSAQPSGNVGAWPVTYRTTQETSVTATTDTFQGDAAFVSRLNTSSWKPMTSDSPTSTAAKIIRQAVNLLVGRGGWL